MPISQNSIHSTNNCQIPLSAKGSICAGYADQGEGEGCSFGPPEAHSPAGKSGKLATQLMAVYFLDDRDPCLCSGGQGQPNPGKSIQMRWGGDRKGSKKEVSPAMTETSTSSATHGHGEKLASVNQEAIEYALTLNFFDSRAVRSKYSLYTSQFSPW